MTHMSEGTHCEITLISVFYHRDAYQYPHLHTIVRGNLLLCICALLRFSV